MWVVILLFLCVFIPAAKDQYNYPLSTFMNVQRNGCPPSRKAEGLFHILVIEQNEPQYQTFQ